MDSIGSQMKAVTPLTHPRSTLTRSPVKYKRYKILTSPISHRYPIPHPFLPQVRKLGLAKILLSEVFEYNFKLVQSKYRAALLSRPCIYGVFSGKLGGFSPVQERCVGCMRCVQEFPDVCTVDRNPEYTHLADSYWMPQDPNKMSESSFATVWYEASTGKIPVRGMGYKGLFAGSGWDSMWTDMSEIVRPTRDGVYGREFISTQVDIGRKPSHLDFTGPLPGVNIASLPIPILFDYLPDTISSTDIIQSIRQASEETGTRYILDVKQIERLGLKYHPSIIPLITGAYSGECDTLLAQVRIIEITEPDQQSIDAIRHLNSDVVLVARLQFTEDISDEIQRLFRLGIDSFHLLADYHGRSADGEVFVKELIHEVHTSLVEQGIRDQLSLIVSGGMIMAEHIPKAIIMGADAIAIDTAALVALQVKFGGECRIAQTATIYEDAFDPTWGRQRLVNLLGSWHNQLIEIMSAMGIKEIRRLRGDTGRAMTRDQLEQEAFEGIEVVGDDTP